MSNDGRNDIIVLHNGYATIGVYMQSSDGTFQSEERYRHFNPQAMAVGDINGDGLNDVAAVDSNGGLTILYHKPALSAGSATARKSQRRRAAEICPSRV
ncbi:MAG TPA: VCBS repeat-containing protein [Geobacteraceae bacterium]|nr:VCBS repeat-containing protein [Geobacteraceae bacterium]